MTTKNKAVVYESPDGGKTVYARLAGESHRHLIKSEMTEHKKWLLWKDILDASKHNNALKELLEKAEMLYALMEETN